MAGHCNCLEGNLLSSFGAAVMDVEDVAEDNVLEAFVLLTREVPYQLGVDPQGREVDPHPSFLHRALVAVGPDSRMECYSDARIHHNCYYLGVHSHQDHPFACRNAHLGAVVLLGDLHNKDVGLDLEDLEGLLCYYTSCVVGVP